MEGIINKLMDHAEKHGEKKTMQHGIIAIGGVLLLVGGICFITYFAKKAEQNNQSTNNLQEAEKNAELENKKIETKKNAEIEKIEARKNAEIEKMKMREQLRKKSNDAKENPTATDTSKNDKIDSYHDIIKNSTIIKNEEKKIGFPWLREGYDTGLVGPTDCGKSTFIMQAAIAIAKGKCETSLSPQWENIAPTPVLLFSLEQSVQEINHYYGDTINNLATLKIYADTSITPAQIINIVKKEAEKADNSGLVVVIDNYTKLEEMAGVKAMKEFCQQLDHLRQQIRNNGAPITPLKVYHAKSEYDFTKPLTPSMVRGDKKNVIFTNNFLYFTYCNLGSDKRVLGYIKMKHGDKKVISVLEYAGTKIDQFRYVGQGCEQNIGKPQAGTEERNLKSGPGRKPMYSLEDIIILHQMIQNKECTYQEVEKVYGVKKSAIKKRIKRNCEVGLA